ncbi:MAG: PEP-CTERM sorting domain-containing protein [Nanoarchaeota archaeon]|nr:PEP-CTERM sorting domain-containing protein [Nanoarchaeota archaeon]
MIKSLTDMVKGAGSAAGKTIRKGLYGAVVAGAILGYSGDAEARGTEKHSGRDIYSISFANHPGGGSLIFVDGNKKYFVADKNEASKVVRDINDGYLTHGTLIGECESGEYGFCEDVSGVHISEFTNSNSKFRRDQKENGGLRGDNYDGSFRDRVTSARGGERGKSDSGGRYSRTLSDDGTVSAAATVNVPDFCFFADMSSVQRVEMALGDNLMENDPPVVVSDSHLMGFISYDPFSVDGCADNPFLTFEGWEGYITGRYSYTLGVGNKPNDLWMLEDLNGDGIGTYEPSTGKWTVGADDYFYSPEETFLNDISLDQGGTNELPPLGSFDDLPSMKVVPVPEPETAVGLLTGMAMMYGMKRRMDSKKSQKYSRGM